MSSIENPKPQETYNPPPNRWQVGLFEPKEITKHAKIEIERLNDTSPNDESKDWKIGIVVIDGEDPSSVLGREVERVVFGEFFSNDIERLKMEYEEYDARSTFIVAIDRENLRPVGAMRLLGSSSGEGLKSLDDIASPEYGWHIEKGELAKRMEQPTFMEVPSVDLVTLAIAPDYRSGEVLDALSAHLYYGLYQWSRKHGYEDWVGILDTGPLNKIQLLGKPLDFFKGVEPREYIDSPSSIPFYANLDRIDQKTKEVGIYDFFIMGQGLNPSIKFDISRLIK